MQDERLAAYLSGERLYGDDFDVEEIASWFDDEREAYANLGARDRESYRYVYHALNAYHAFRHLPDRTFKHALGFGSAYGDEFAPIADRIDRLTIVEPSGAFENEAVCGIPTEFVEPAMDGKLQFEDGSFDIITCLGVLHHIPNVTRVVHELGRVTASGGVALIREPVISMGDWRREREGLTSRERGIPRALLDEMLVDAGFDILNASMCIFPVVRILGAKLGMETYNSAAATRADAFLSWLFRWNVSYHATHPWQKLRPTARYYVAERSRQKRSR